MADAPQAPAPVTPGPDAGMVPLVNPQGELVRVPEGDYPRAMQQGFKPPSPAQMHEMALQQGAQGVGQGLAAFGEGAANAITGGLFTPAEVATGITTRERVEARQKYQPVPHGAGTILGIAAPLIATGGADAPLAAGEAGAAEAAEAAPGLLSRAAQYTAPALIAKAGQGTKALVEGMGLPGAIGRIAPTLAAGAVEGAAYAAPDVTEKALLGDPQMTWEHAASELGTGALFGGALGGATKGLAELIPDSLGEKAADWLGRTAGERNLKAAAGPGGRKGIIRRLSKQIGQEDLTKIGQEMGDAGLVGPLSTPEKTYDLAQAYREEAGDEMGRILDAADASPSSKPPSIGDVLGRAREEILQPLADNPLDQAAAKSFGDVLDGYAEKYGKPGSFGKDTLGFKDLHEIRKQVSAEIYGLRGTADPMANKMKDALHDFRSLLSDHINQGLEDSGLSSDAWKAANRRYQVGSVAQQLSEEGMLGHVGNNFASLTEIMSGLAGAVAHGAVGGGLSAIGMHVAREHSAGAIGWAATAAQRKLLALTARNSNALTDGVTNLFGHAGGAIAGHAAAAVTQDDYPKVSANINTYNSNLDKFAEDLSNHLAPLKTHAPATAQAATQFAGQVVQHLASKLPQAPQKLMFDPPFKPSATELAVYNRHHEIAEHGPVAVLQHLAAGTLTQEHMETSQALYPKLHVQAQAQVLDKLTAKVSAGEPVPYSLRLRIASFLGMPLEHAMTPQAILAAQVTYANAPAEGPQAQGTPGMPREVDTEFGQRLSTSTQGVNTRLEHGA